MGVSSRWFSISLRPLRSLRLKHIKTERPPPSFSRTPKLPAAKAIKCYRSLQDKRRRNLTNEHYTREARSTELRLDEGFAFVAELEGEEVAALVEGAEEELVPFPQLLRQELALRQPHELAFVAVGERAGELRAGEEVHVLDAPFVGHERDESAEARIEHGEPRLLLHLAHRAFHGAFSVFELSADANPLVAVFVVLLLGSVEDEIASVLLDVAEGRKSWGVY